ncbi:MAG: hypothetical protein ACI4JD_00955 [Ruminococcus sp.]
MNIAQKILLIMGSGYIAIGSVVTFAFVDSGQGGPYIMLPLFFVALGIAFVVGVFFSIAKKKKISRLGKRYPAKIYGYVDNTSYRVNGAYTVNTKVHYFDESGTEREAIIPTSFARGSNMYPIGMTIDIFEYQGKYDFDPKSVRNEILPREYELMDDKPLEPEKAAIVSVSCQSCGATYEAASGYSNKCPYCGSYHNA